MRVVFYTHAQFRGDELFRYTYARVASRFGNGGIVAVRPPNDSRMLRNFNRWRRKIGRLGMLNALEIVSSYPLQRAISIRQTHEGEQLLRLAPRPDIAPPPEGEVYVPSANGPEAVEAIGGFKPEVLLHCGAGILEPQIFTLPQVACLNVHPGIAPLIRGVAPINWALWENRPEWIGATVHRIDAGIDTGEVLAYAPVKRCCEFEGFATLFARIAQRGVDQLLAVLTRLAAGESWQEPVPPGKHLYRSTISGWKLAALELRLARHQARHGRPGSGRQSASATGI
ncbi:MAG: formyl transferase [Bryobacteraceae bacterium]|jgi:hypothetical protein